jgi:hypothetical protein
MIVHPRVMGPVERPHSAFYTWVRIIAQRFGNASFMLSD